MSTNLFRSLLAAVVIAVLAVTAAPVIANAAMENMASHCDSNPSPEKAAMMKCCQASDCPMFRLSDAVDKQAILFSSTTGTNSHIALNTFTDSDSSSTCNKPPPHDPTQDFPIPFHLKYQCRNCLNSDDPFSL